MKENVGECEEKRKRKCELPDGGRRVLLLCF